MRKLTVTGIKKIYPYPIMLLALLLSTITITKARYNPFQKPAPSPIEGRWDITIDVDGKNFPSWLEVRHSGLHMLIGQYTGISGSARPVSRVNFSGGKLSFLFHLSGNRKTVIW